MPKKKVEKKIDKNEISVMLNKVFGVDIDWTKLNEYELTQLLTVLANPDALIKRLGGYTKNEFEEKMREDVVGGVVNILKKWQGPVVSTIREMLKEFGGVRGEGKSE